MVQLVFRLLVFWWVRSGLLSSGDTPHPWETFVHSLFILIISFLSSLWQPALLEWHAQQSWSFSCRYLLSSQLGAGLPCRYLRGQKWTGENMSMTAYGLYFKVHLGSHSMLPGSSVCAHTSTGRDQNTTFGSQFSPPPWDPSIKFRLAVRFAHPALYPPSYLPVLLCW